MKNILPSLLFVSVACGGPKFDPVLAPEGWADDPSVVSLIDGLVGKVRAQPGEASTHRTLGYAYIANSAWPQAVQSLQNSLAIDPDDPSTRFHLATALGQAGDLDGRLAELERLVAANPTFTPGVLHLGVEYLERDRLDEAADAFQAVESQQSAHPHGAIGLAEVSLARGEPQRAVQHLQRALQLAAGENYAKLLLAQAYAQLGQEDRAHAFSEQGAGAGRPRMNPPSHAEIEGFKVSWGDRLSRAIQLLGKEEAGAALVLLERLHQEDPEQEVALNNLAVAYMRLSRFDEALVTIEKALTIKPDQHESLWNRASCYYHKGLAAREAGQDKVAEDYYETGLQALRECLRISPRMPRAYAMRGKIELARKRIPEAIQAFRNAVVQGDTSEETYVNLARIVIPVEGQEAGLRILQESVAQTGARMESRYQLCGMLLGMERGPEARTVQREMAAVQPNHPLTQRAHQALQQRGF